MNTIIAGNRGGSGVLASDAALACSDLYENEGGDWVGDIADQLGVNGNICEDPLFCNADAGNLMVRDDSPCAPIHDPDCGLIGAWPVGCLSADVGDLAARGVLLHCEPNPFRESTRVVYEIPVGGPVGPVSLGIYDMAGRLVRLLASGGAAAGRRDAVWDGRTEHGEMAAGGVYFCRLSQGRVVQTRRIVRIP